eukprot:6208030-Pleurochrysis_carterae.AAC.1
MWGRGRLIWSMGAWVHGSVGMRAYAPPNAKSANVRARSREDAARAHLKAVLAFVRRVCGGEVRRHLARAAREKVGARALGPALA